MTSILAEIPFEDLHDNVLASLICGILVIVVHFGIGIDFAL